MKSTSEKKYRVVDLFAGAGGLSCGFLQTEHYDIVAAFENNLNAQKTYRRNHPNTDVYGDVSEVFSAEIGKVDVVIGGPPCQGFSNANRQKNHAVSQNNSLVKKYIQAVLHLNPIAFVMENVSMLQSNIHRFFVDTSDADIISKYNIQTEETCISLLDYEFMFDDAASIVADKDEIARYLWKNDNDYLTLNAIYKYRKNPKKLPASLSKYKSRLLSLAKRITDNQCANSHISRAEVSAGKAITNYFSEPGFCDADFLCRSIEPVIMLQRMFSKAKEIRDNDIIVSEFSTERGLFARVNSMVVIDYIESILGASSNGYSLTKGVLSAVNFGVPQKRMRFVIMGVKKVITDSVQLPSGTFSENNYRSVFDAISDIEGINTKTNAAEGETGIALPAYCAQLGVLGRMLRDSNTLYNHVTTETTPEALKRFEAIQQGDNFHSLGAELKTNYSDPTRTQNTIYLRLKYDEPSGTVVNVRKSMWIHPVLNRALSVREAARLQTFPDSFVFFGTKDSQYQQVGNAVPPMLAQAIAEHLCKYLDSMR
ncbi:MAG: DNA cytosine methyltransferase [Campylobacteraceae bacterium]|jgi:DNA (cytosine-5)-methyltransferase 1|nr:DNA cytosine methyltransferase [Campylobacteraceae bacterium]